jgi:hypothetical protein
MSLEIPVGGSDEIRAAGLVATRYRVVDADTGASVVIGPITTGITNTGTQRYKATLSVPDSTAVGDYEVQWDDGSGAWTAIEDLVVFLPSTDVAPTLTDLSRKFPGGTVVGAYPGPAGPPHAEGAPIGPAEETATVSSAGTVTFAALRAGVDYFIGAQVSGEWRWVRYHS